ncbi:MAG: nucleotidyltransferase domain-containing protein [Candidatus Acidiferrales bacterium]
MPPAFIGTLEPEKQLLICCARTRIRPESARKIRILAAGALDWERLFSDAAEHSLMPLLDRHLHEIMPAALTPPQNRRWKEAIHANAVRCLRLTASLMEALGEFSLRSIPAIPYKGPVLAAQAYGDVALRAFDDVDVILRQKDMPRAHDAMCRLGYRPRFPPDLEPGVSGALVPGEYKYYSEARDVIVELHTEKTLRHFPVEPDLDDFLERRVAVAMSGHELRTFAPEDALIALSIHGAKDFWGRMSWITDIAELIQSHPQLDWDRVATRGESLRAQRMLHLGLILAASLLDAPLPEDVVRAIKGDEIAGRVAKELEQKLLTDGQRPWSASARFRFRARMLTNPIAGWRYAARLAVAPAEEDWQMLRLPAPLAPLYFFLRPLRLLQKYGQMPGSSNRTIF